MTLRRSSLLLLMLAVVLLVQTGCGGGNFVSSTTTPGSPVASLSVTALSFAAQTVGTASAAQTVTLTNTGTATLAVSGAGLSGANASSFAVNSGCGGSLAAGASCTLSVTFTPASVGSYAATLQVNDSAAGAPQTVTLTGNGTAAAAPVATLSATSYDFGNQLLYSKTTQTITLSNTGTAPLAIGSVALSGVTAVSFTVSSGCGTTLAPGASCGIAVTFSPALVQALTASLTITDSAANSPQVVALSGAGTLPLATLSSNSLSFTQAVGSTSAAQTVTLSNTGNAPLQISSLTLTGAGSSSFAFVSGCGSTVAVGATCTISVTFTPATNTGVNATLIIADNSIPSTAQLGLNGTGQAASLSVTPTSLNVSSTAGATSTSTVTLTNTGNAALTLQSPQITGAGASAFSMGASSCGSSLAAGASCFYTIYFQSATAGTSSASLVITSSAPASPLTIPLTGTATAPAVVLSSSALTFTQAVGGTSAAQTVTLTNSGTAALAVSSIGLSGTNASSFAQSNTCGSNVAAGASCTISVTFTPGTASSYTASLVIADNVAGSPQSVPLTGTGTGTPSLMLSPATLSFTQAAESTSAAQTVTLSNTGTAAATLTGMSLGGANPLAYATTTTCGATLAAGANCTIAVTFTPSIASALTATLQVASNASANLTAALTGTGTGTLTINTSSATDWKISNGAITLDYNSTNGHVFAVHLAGDSTNLVDTTSSNAGLYMDDTGQGTGTQTSTYVQNGNAYIDWSLTVASSASNPFTYTQHFVITANDPGFHVYSTVGHSATDIAGSIGQWQYVFRIGLGLFTETYEVNSGLGNLGVIDVPQPDPSVSGTTDPGRQVQNAAVDLHGLTLPSGFTRGFYTKYDYSSYEYLHKAHGVYGSKYGAWLVLPKTESLVGGPTKQDLVFTDNIIIMEALSSHLDNSLAYTPPQGVATNRFFGPYYFHFNTFTATNTTPAALYNEAQTYAPEFDYLYDLETTMIGAGYTTSTGRGTVAPAVAGAGSSTPLTAWTVLSDNATNFQYSSSGAQYWVNQTTAGTSTVPLTGVIPGTYRLSSYVLGQWGEHRQDNVVVTANKTTPVTGTFTPENFGPSQPIWTIGTPDRSGHEFLHGHDPNGNDLRNYWGAYNYWADFAANKGAQVYYATAVGSTPATNDLSQINYVQWKNFDPPLYAGIYNGADDTTDGYNYIVPSYVGNPSTAVSPGLQIHFTTNASQLAQGQYATLSVGVACAEASAVVTLNGHQLIWHYSNASDCMIRSGLAGYYQWFVMQFPVSYLNAAGADNVIILTTSQTDGFMLDAMRFEITNTTADPAVTGWHDYEYLYGSTDTPANDKVPSN